MSKCEHCGVPIAKDDPDDADICEFCVKEVETLEEMFLEVENEQG